MVTCEVTNDSLSKSTEESLKVDCGKLFFIYKENIIEYDIYLKYFILYDYIYFAVEKFREETVGRGNVVFYSSL